MKNLFWRTSVFLISFSLVAPRMPAQETNEVGQLKRQLQQMQENFERVQREQKEQIDSLSKKLEELTKQQSADAEKKKLEQQLAAELQSGPTNAAATATATPAWSPSQ